jgi:hypothetical protein
MLGAGIFAMAQSPRIIEFEAPGAGTTYGYGTESIAINPGGVIAGFYVGYDNVVHAYVRTPDGKFTTFDGPGVPSSAPVDPFSPPSSWINDLAPGTYGDAIDEWGAVAGYYVDASNVAHGYLRAPDGKFTSFDVPHAGTGPGQGTFAVDMNLQGTIAGFYVDTNDVNHGFIRAPHGAITEFDVPAAAIGPGLGTQLGTAQCISTTGAVDGNYFDSDGVAHGFVRDPNGKFTTFEVKATGLTAGQGTYTWGINWAGATVGGFVDANNVYHGLVRAPDGNITVFDVPAAVGNTVSEAINAAGAVVGFYNDANGVHHGFVRSPHGKLTFFDDPAAGNLFHQGTVPMFNTEGAVVGFSIDKNYVWHGFLRLGPLPWFP